MFESVVEIRPANLHEAGMIRDLVRAAYAKWVPVLGREPLPMKADYERAVREHQFDILCVDGGMIGLIETMLRPDHIWIENVAVRPACQGRGFGRRLLAHVKRQAAANGIVEARLLTNEAFEANVALYAGVGYSMERCEPFMGGTTVYMRKRLSR